MEWRSWRNYYEDVAPFTVLMAMEFVIPGLNTLFKAATLAGMSYHVFMIKCASSAQFPILRKIGLLAVIGISCQITGYTGIIYSSPTLQSAMANLMPAFAFILAIFFRMEKLVWSSNSSKAKVMGTIISITGAFVMTLYKGPSIFKASKPSMSLHQPLNLTGTNLVAGANPNGVVGGAFFTAQFTLNTLWYIVLTQIMEEYPAELTAIFFYNSSVCFMALVVALIVKRNARAWRIGSDIALASVVCWLSKGNLQFLLEQYNPFMDSAVEGTSFRGNV
ncbi:Nodulin MtN21 /EamA-like transporter family protein isoform 2 [Hibiscus syriacus]|uniref:Nodulin MtN21 /EamA-like transporter family protein isoform 2 n=1 Tax=Hibiscus syriacus TaxID=106335 RepID=A0A6A3BZ69_HIBSY|nr:Nodulin MtN21 /EamA-like transporter family protein isoform 2 [Hibiscus syriacus]